MSISEILEKFRQAEWICINDKDDTDKKIENRLDHALSAIKSELLEKIENLKSDEDERGLYGDALRTSRRDRGIRNEALSQIKKIIEEA
jgi:hypothetical protein